VERFEGIRGADGEIETIAEQPQYAGPSRSLAIRSRRYPPTFTEVLISYSCSKRHKRLRISRTTEALLKEGFIPAASRSRSLLSRAHKSEQPSFQTQYREIQKDKVNGGDSESMHPIQFEIP
jgi:hypothetical protein